jgi:hypothetical protein
MKANVTRTVTHPPSANFRITDNENGPRERQTETIHKQPAQPKLVGMSYFPPMAAHTQLRNAKGQKDIDRTHNNQQPYVTTGV